MTRSKKRSEGSVRRVADATLDVALGATALAADKAIETFDKLAERADEAFRHARRETRERARATRKRAEKLAGRAHRTAPQDARAYEDRTRDELYELAAKRAIEGRSSMNKAELIQALRAQP